MSLVRKVKRKIARVVLGPDVCAVIQHEKAKAADWRKAQSVRSSVERQTARKSAPVKE